MSSPKTIEASNASCELFFGEAGVRVRISDVVRISDGYADFLSVDIRVSYRWVPRNRVGAFVWQSKILAPIGRWSTGGVNPRRVLRNTKIGSTGWSGSRSRLVDEL